MVYIFLLFVRSKLKICTVIYAFFVLWGTNILTKPKRVWRLSKLINALTCGMKHVDFTIILTKSKRFWRLSKLMNTLNDVWWISTFVGTCNCKSRWSLKWHFLWKVSLCWACVEPAVLSFSYLGCKFHHDFNFVFLSRQYSRFFTLQQRWGKWNIWVPDGNRTHDLSNTSFSGTPLQPMAARSEHHCKVNLVIYQCKKIWF